MKLDKNTVELMDVDLCGVCNLDCPMCAFNFIDIEPKNHLPLKDWITLLDEYSSLKHIILAGAYSEPTIYKYFLELCGYLKTRGIDITINTNGSLHSELWWSKLAGILTPADRVEFAIDGSTQEIHSVYRVNSSLKKVLANAKAFRSHNHNDYAQCIRFEYNKEDCDNVKQLASLEGFEDFILIDSSPLYEENSFLPYKYKKPFDTSRIGPCKELRDKYVALDKYAEHVVKTKEGRELACMSLQEKGVHLDHYGTVQPCCFFKERGIKNWDEDYKDILDFKYDVCYVCEKSWVGMADLLEAKEQYVY